MHPLSCGKRKIVTRRPHSDRSNASLVVASVYLVMSLRNRRPLGHKPRNLSVEYLTLLRVGEVFGLDYSEFSILIG